MKHPKPRAISAHILAFAITICSTAGIAQPSDSTAITIAKKKILHSKILNEARTLYIHYPSVMKPGERYPVLYLLDGEAQIELAAGQLTYLSESYRIIPPLIIVGIANTDRVRDLTPTHYLIGKDGNPDTSANAFGRNSGGGEKFLRFIKEELMPFVEADSSTAPYRILSGHSLGALLALHCFRYHPDYFDAYIAMSPSLQWDNEALLSQLSLLPDSLKGLRKRLFLCDGNEDNEFHQRQLRLDSILRQKHIPGLAFRYTWYSTEEHTALPVKAFYEAIRFIYPDWYMPLSNAAFKQNLSSAIVIDHYKRLSRDYGYTVIPPEDEINAIGRFLRNDPAHIADAISLLEMNAANYPTSSLVYEHLGDTYLRGGDKAKALKNYEKAEQRSRGSEKIKQKMAALK